MVILGDYQQNGASNGYLFTTGKNVDWSKLKGFAGSNINVAYVMEFVFEWAEKPFLEEEKMLVISHLLIITEYFCKVLPVVVVSKHF